MRRLATLLLLASTCASAGIIRQNVRHLSKSGSTGLIGDVTLSPGSNITLTQSGQDIAINASASSSITVSTKTVSYSLSSADNWVLFNCSTPCAATLESAVSNTGVIHNITNIGTAPVTVTGSQTISDETNQYLYNKNDNLTVGSNGSTWNVQ
jgi:hypothetical protein